MELVNVNENNQATPTTTSRRSSISNWPRFILLRKYSSAICLLEALAIVLIIGYLFFKEPQVQPEPLPASRASLLRVFQNESNKTSLLVGLVQDCSQRVHDLPYSVKCQSSNLELCPDLEQIDDHEWRAIRNKSVFTCRTSKAGDRMKFNVENLPRFDCKSTNQQQNPCRFKTILTINRNKRYQKIIGWGGALTDSSINNILSLSTNGTRQLLNDYFGNDGILMNMIRITIGGSDFSSRFYTNIDEPENETLRLRAEDTLYKIPMLQYIQEKFGTIKTPIKIFASMWSPPVWMKTNNHFNKGNLKGSPFVTGEKSSSNGTYFRILAMLKKQFLLSYMDHGIQFWGLTVMNEPYFAVQPFLTFNTMIFPKEEYAAYVANYLGPTIKDNPKLNHIKLMVHDDNRRYLMQYTDDVLKNKAARRYIDGVSTHGYIDEDFHLMKEIQLKHNNTPGQAEPLFILPTELCSGHLPFMEKAILGNWHRGVHYGIDIIKGLQNSASGWVDWNMALDTTGGPGWLGGKLDSPVIVDKANDAYHRNPMFYVLGQFSRFIPPGSVRIESSITNDLYDYRLETVTFQDPEDNIIIVILNKNPYKVELYIKLAGGIEGDTYLMECSPDSVTTVKLDPNLFTI